MLAVLMSECMNCKQGYTHTVYVPAVIIADESYMQSSITLLAWLLCQRAMPLQQFLLNSWCIFMSNTVIYNLLFDCLHAHDPFPCYTRPILSSEGSKMLHIQFSRVICIPVFTHAGRWLARGSFMQFNTVINVYLEVPKSLQIVFDCSVANSFCSLRAVEIVQVVWPPEVVDKWHMLCCIPFS